MKIDWKKTVIVILLLVTSLLSKAQDRVLEQTISITFQNVTIPTALKSLEKELNIYFTYNPEQISYERLINQEFTNTAALKVLQFILGKESSFKQIGNNVIIRIPNTEDKPTVKKVVVTGSIRNAKTGDKIENVSVFQIDKKSSSLSNKESYQLEVKDKEGYVELGFNKKDYKDTVIIVKTDQLEHTNIELVPLVDSVSKVRKDSSRVEKINIVKAITKEEQRTQVENIDNYSINRFAQTSLLPFVSTNGKMNTHSVNKLSLNIAAGYSQGVNGIEVGGLLNINRKYMQGIQASGFGNIVGGQMQGAQLSGFVNVSLDSAVGIQLTGFVNSSIGHTSGLQASGFVNSILKNGEGIQATGFLNMVWGHYTGTQLSGMMNLTRYDLEGIQLTGFVNYARDVNGLQGSGFVNYARDVKGIQLSILNKARDLRGLQLGLFNFSNSSKGVSIGLLSFIKEGYQSLDITTSDVYSGNLSFKTGTNRFYNIINIGAVSTSDRNHFAAGYGFGTRVLFGKKLWSFDLDNTFNFFLNDDTDPENEIHANFLYNADLFLSRVLSEHFIFRVGATFNSYTRNDNIEISYIPSNTIVTGNTITETWLGYKAGIAYNF